MEWANQYKALGEKVFEEKSTNKAYTKEFKEQVSFAIQALSAKYLVEHASELTEKLIDVPEEVDKDVAKRKLAFLGKEIDVLTPEQEKYLNSYAL